MTESVIALQIFSKVIISHKSIGNLLKIDYYSQTPNKSVKHWFETKQRVVRQETNVEIT